MADGSSPGASVVVPTRNRPQRLAGCLQALAALEPPPGGFEVIVVDDGGSGGLTGLVSEAGRSLHVTLLKTPHEGPAAARNAGIAKARGGVVAFTDDDCRPRPPWLRALVRELERSPEALVGGETVVGTEGISAQASQLVSHLVYAHFNDDPQNARFLASNNLAVRAEELQAAGGFDASFRTSEDRELCDRWRFAGKPIVYVPGAIVEHAPELTPLRFAAQHFGYGRGASRYHRVRARRQSGRLQHDLAFHARLPALLRRELRRVPRRRIPAVAGFLVLWQVANLAGFVWEAAAGRAAAGGQRLLRAP